MTTFRIVAAIATMVFPLFAANGSSSAVDWRRVSSFRFDWDHHKNVSVVLEIDTPAAADTFTRIRIRVPGRREFVLNNQDGWARYRSGEGDVAPGLLKATNLVRSDYVLALSGAENRTLLFLVGPGYGSSRGSLHVLEISGAGQPRLVLHVEEMGLTDVRDLDADGTAEIIGAPCYSQSFGNDWLTYDPFNVFKIAPEPGAPAKLSIPLSKKYNLKHYYGWAGPECSEKIVVVLHPSKGRKPVIMTLKEAERTEGRNSR